MENKLAVVFMVVMVGLFSKSEGYSTGPPVGQAGRESLCSDMNPSGHGALAQTSTSPYSITLGNSCYKAGDTVTVSITGGSFKGFLLVVGSGSNNSVGTFSTGSQSGIQQLGCFGQAANAVGHNTSTTVSSASFSWTAPAVNYTDTVYMRATVVQSKAIFWKGMVSSNLIYDANCTSSTSKDAAERVVINIWVQFAGLLGIFMLQMKFTN